jgi:hypothetical protein
MQVNPRKEHDVRGSYDFSCRAYVLDDIASLFFCYVWKLGQDRGEHGLRLV